MKDTRTFITNSWAEGVWSYSPTLLTAKAMIKFVIFQQQSHISVQQGTWTYHVSYWISYAWYSKMLQTADTKIFFHILCTIATRRQCTTHRARRCSWECTSPQSEFLQTPAFKCVNEVALLYQNYQQHDWNVISMRSTSSNFMLI